MTKRLFAFLTSMSLVFIPPMTATAAPDCVVYVDGDAGAGGDGQSWSTAFDDIQVAIDTAALELDIHDRCQVWVSAGEYIVYQGLRNDTLAMQTRVDVYGGFAGFETSTYERNLDENQSILLGGPSFSEMSTRVYHVVTAADDSLIDGFDIVFGLADGVGLNAYGGGIFVPIDATPIIRGCRIYFNTADYGGGLFSFAGAPVIQRTYFIFNEAVYYGGAAFLYLGSSWTENSILWGNYATNDGGGVYQLGGNWIYADTEFIGNQAGHYGGGLAFQPLESGDTILVMNGDFQGNDAVRGGAVYNLLQNTTSGSAKYVYTDTVFRENVATQFGSAFYNDFTNSFGGLDMRSCLFHDNDAGSKGTVYNGSPSGDPSIGPRIINSTFARNTASWTTGGVRNWQIDAGIINSIFWDNDFVGIHDGIGASSDVRYSSLQMPWTGSGAGNRVGNPNFVGAANNNFRLASASPCIDAAEGYFAPNYDHDGHSRYDIEWSANLGLGTPDYADMGAYEYRRLLYRRDVADPAATCLAGEPADYYVRPGFGTGVDKWVIYLQGGGLCYDKLSCENRQRTQVYPYDEETLSIEPTVDNRQGILSDHPLENSEFHNFNQVYVHYCSSDLWMGSGPDGGNGHLTFTPKGDTIPLHGEFRGSLIFSAVINELKNPTIMGELGMPRIDYASEVLLAGSSAGGLGTLSNLDKLATLLSPWTEVKGFNDAGWLIDVHEPVSLPSGTLTVHDACKINPPPTQIHYSYLDEIFMKAWNAFSGVDASCKAWIDSESGDHYERCLYGDFLLDPAHPFINTQLYVHMSQLDTSGAGLGGLLTPPPPDEALCTAAYSQRIRDTFDECITDGFSEHQETHGIANKDDFMSLAIGGVSAYTHFSNWFEDIPQPSPLIE
ncbi:MAG: hypothetical protein GY854_19210 [Deltaproteobacteria bacterium]|nr:hypothetical protein [Deltaproteobacteria bacterium]